MLLGTSENPKNLYLYLFICNFYEPMDGSRCDTVFRSYNNNHNNLSAGFLLQSLIGVLTCHCTGYNSIFNHWGRPVLGSDHVPYSSIYNDPDTVVQVKICEEKSLTV